MCLIDGVRVHQDTSSLATVMSGLGVATFTLLQLVAATNPQARAYEPLRKCMSLLCCGCAGNVGWELKQILEVLATFCGATVSADRCHSLGIATATVLQLVLQWVLAGLAVLVLLHLRCYS